MLPVLTLAALVAAPEPTPAFSEALLQAYPEWAVRNDKSAAATISLWMSPDGRIYDCKTLNTLGDERLANEICGLLLRKRMKHAVDHTGEPAVGNMVTVMKFGLPGTPEGDKIGAARHAPEMTLQLNRLPDGLTSPHDIGLGVEVDATGKAIGCNGDKRANSTLAAIACDRLAGELFDKGLDAKGSPTAYVRTFKVRFSMSVSSKP